MKIEDILAQRRQTQHLAGKQLQKIEDVVQLLCAVQSQDYGGAKWAIGQRVHAATNELVDKAFNDGTILRTHVMRPTWHFVLPADIRWILLLTAPRVHAISAYYYRKTELTEEIFTRSENAFTQALRGGKYLTREELANVLKEVGITASGLRFVYILMHAELEAIICSGPRRGKQFTYALLEERVPQSKILKKDEALAELTLRYFTGHGPALLKDFMWWSGLTVTEAKTGIEMVKSQLKNEVIDEQIYWFTSSIPQLTDISQTVYLLPNYDEYLIGYKDHTGVFDVEHASLLDARQNVVFNHFIVIGGQIWGTWRREFKKGSIIIRINPFRKFTSEEIKAIHKVANEYGKFFNLPVTVTQ